MKQIEFLWDGGADMDVMTSFVNKKLKELQEKRFKILDIKSFGTSLVSMKTGAITHDPFEAQNIEDTALFEGLVIGVIYDDNL